MKVIHDPSRLVKSEFANEEDYLLKKQVLEFKLGQCYEDEPAKTLTCLHCVSDKFKVGQGDCFTAVKCTNCKYEVCIHDG